MTEASPLLPRPMRKLAGRALESALNRAVDLDPETRERVRALEGRRVVVHMRGPELTLSVHVKDGHLRVGPAPAAPDASPALRVTASPGSLLAMALQRGEDGIAPGKVEIAGDAGLARQLERLARGYAPDVEEAFAQRFGDVLGVPLARTLQRGVTHLRRGARHATEDVADWLREESRLAVAPAEMDDFLDDVDALRERADRLDARLKRLSRTLEPDA
ncbi:ubiquinone biosynthesis accessory factor UbiJ [Oleiagrimonas soli]|uniref:Ubiquinone biosynthesis accessory factor UbiJ n=1 Tax=Oleiagrimonas soli TaxID=1543381 RepID=A0A099D1F1_9GAMM|nr:SCP2 sterol-binding domain-containing protein [Oleiagrimonas soli]KGI79125.1 sterol-binding protein [Oleiagrimonas soli]MBB6184706.1 ubiquinone biosynthesis protein UbiJ [Oleiagrimonas soli]